MFVHPLLVPAGHLCCPLLYHRRNHRLLILLHSCSLVQQHTLHVMGEGGGETTITVTMVSNTAIATDTTLKHLRSMVMWTHDLGYG